MNEIIIKDEIENMIYEIRGKQVMLASDLARLYNCKNGTKSLNLAVKRHINRFPERFMFQLTDEESSFIWFQVETKKKNYDIETRGGKFDKPYVFTEQGVAMLSSILRTDIAEKVSIKIIDAFVNMRKYINTNKDTLLNIETKLIEHDNQLLNQNKRIDILFDKLDSKEKNHIFFEGEIYDAHSLLIDILNKAKKEIII